MLRPPININTLLQANAGTGLLQLSFEAIAAPEGSSPIYEYRLFNASSSAPVGNWERIYLIGNTGNGSETSPYKIFATPDPGRYTAKIRAKTALGDSATSDESLPSQPEVMGEWGAWTFNPVFSQSSRVEL